MAIGPLPFSTPIDRRLRTKALSGLDPAVRRVVEQCEAEIDAVIRFHPLHLDGVDGVPTEAIEALRELYEACGWQVESTEKGATSSFKWRLRSRTKE